MSATQGAMAARMMKGRQDGQSSPNLDAAGNPNAIGYRGEGPVPKQFKKRKGLFGLVGQNKNNGSLLG
jgi:hypothetical protein